MCLRALFFSFMNILRFKKLSIHLISVGYWRMTINLFYFLGTLVPNRIFVGGISANTTEGELMQLFSNYGTVKAAKIIQDRAGVSKGYGFITFESEDDAKRPLREAENIVLRERKLNIAPAIKKQVKIIYSLFSVNVNLFFYFSHLAALLTLLVLQRWPLEMLHNFFSLLVPRYPISREEWHIIHNLHLLHLGTQTVNSQCTNVRIIIYKMCSQKFFF